MSTMKTTKIKIQRRKNSRSEIAAIAERTKKDRRCAEGKCDLKIVDPEQGILFLEAKGDVAHHDLKSFKIVEK